MSDSKFESLITNGEIIMNTEYPPTNFIVENFIPESGLSIFAASPKTGKSLAMTQLCCRVSGNDTEFLGLKILKNGPVLYMALEDTEARLKTRFLKQKLNPTENMKIVFSWTHDEKAISDLDLYLTEHPEIILVVIDTKAKICEEQGLKNSYQEDYNFLGQIKSCADKHGIAIILVTHLRKRHDDEDVFNEICGTSAIMGTADSIMILKRTRNQNRGILSLTSRDYEEREMEIYLDYETLTWHSNGETSTAIPNMTPERQQIITALKELGGVASPKSIATKLGKDNKRIGNLLAKMETYGFVKKSKKVRGKWTLPDLIEKDFSDSNELEDDYVIE